jgi:hypothetical protein
MNNEKEDLYWKTNVSGSSKNETLCTVYTEHDFFTIS